MISERQRMAPGLLAALHQALRRNGAINSAALAEIAEKWRMPAGEIAATASFYHFFHLPSPKYQILFIDHITDQHAGITALAERLAALLFVEINRLSNDGRVYIGWTSCAGLSDQPPAALINGRPLPALTPDKIDAIAARILADEPVDRWPDHWFTVSNPLWRKGAFLECISQIRPGEAFAAARGRYGTPEAFIAEIAEAGLRGRGGAGFPTATKWQLTRRAAGSHCYLICNADEGEPGTFKDRYLLTQHPDALFDGMTLAAWAIGAQQAILYLRAEYQYLLPSLEANLTFRRKSGLLAAELAPGWTFDIAIALGAGAYVCGEESALIESLEGKPGRPRVRPPFPVTRGYLGAPTAVNNVETLVAAAVIALRGASWWRQFGTDKTPGPKLFSISGDVAKPGIYEFDSGIPLGELIAAAQPIAPPGAVQVSGPSGTLIPLTPETQNRRLAYEDLPCAGAVIVFDQRRDPIAIVHHFARFFARESCGFCTPCRVGTQLIARALEKIVAGRATRYDLERLAPVLEAMRRASNCGFGLSAGNPVRDLIAYFRPQLDARLQPHDFIPAFTLDDELAATRQLTRRDDPHAHLAQFEFPSEEASL